MQKKYLKVSHFTWVILNDKSLVNVMCLSFWIVHCDLYVLWVELPDKCGLSNDHFHDGSYVFQAGCVRNYKIHLPYLGVSLLDLVLSVFLFVVDYSSKVIVWHAIPMWYGCILFEFNGCCWLLWLSLYLIYLGALFPIWIWIYPIQSVGVLFEHYIYCYVYSFLFTWFVSSSCTLLVLTSSAKLISLTQLLNAIFTLLK